MKKEKAHFDYHFKCVNPADFVLTLESSFDNKLIQKIFDSSIKVLRKRQGIKIEDNLDGVDKINIEGNYLNLINTYMRKVLKNIEANIKSDDILILRNSIKKCWFERNVNKKDQWLIHVLYEGNYINK